MGSWPIQLARHVQDHGAFSPDDLSGPISAQLEKDPVILKATATHWRYGCMKCSGYALQCVDGHYHVGKSQPYVIANMVQQQALFDLGWSAAFPVCWNLSSSRLIVGSWRWKCRATSFADMPAVSIPMALSRCSRVIPGRHRMTFDIDFQRFFSPVFCAYDKKTLELCTVWPVGDHPFCCAHTALDFH